MPLQKTDLDSPPMRCPENTQQIHRTPTSKCDPNKTAQELYWNQTSAQKPLCKLAAYYEYDETLCNKSKRKIQTQFSIFKR